MNKTLGALLIIASIGLSGCDLMEQPKAQQSTSGAVQAAPSKVRTNSRHRTVEQQNIDDRNKVLENPTSVLWIHLIAIDGKIIRRMPVVAKVTSSGKRLEAKHFFPNRDAQTTPPSSGGSYTDELIGPDGTFGESDPYIYWFDPQHRYHQWGTAGGLGYLLTDYPIDLKNPIDEITGMYNVSKLAAEWQAQQEKNLKEAK